MSAANSWPDEPSEKDPQSAAPRRGEHAGEVGGKSVLDAVRGGDAAAIMRHLRETADPIMVALLDPNPNASVPFKLELKRRRRGRPPRNTQNTIAEKVRAAASTGAKVESQIAELEKNGVSRSTTLRYRKLLDQREKK